MNWSGHLWTVVPRLASLASPKPPPHPDERVVRLAVSDPERGSLHLGAVWRDAPTESPARGDRGREALVVVHGLGGSAQSPYARRSARAAATAGLASLRLNLRGSGREGEDFFHAGQSEDLHEVLADPLLAPFEHLYLLGFSLGGHLALRAATEERLDPRVRSVAAVCPPLDLAPCAEAFDRPASRLYRRYILGGLRSIYGAVAERGDVELPVPLDEACRIDSIVEWDERIVAPRYGFEGAQDYYRRASVASRLGDLRVPARIVAAPGDPLVPAHTLRAVLAERSPPRLEVTWTRHGGHVGFPWRLRLGEADAEPGLLPQLLGWLRRAA